MSTRSLNELDKKNTNDEINQNDDEDDDDDDDEDYVPNEKVKESDEEPDDEPDNLDDELSENENSPSKSKKAKLEEEKNSAQKNGLNSKRTEDLWSEFLSDVKTSTTTSTNANNSKQETASKEENPKAKPNTQIKPKTSPATVVKPPAKGGIASILNKINKEPKISTLEKSRLDWEEYKKSENLEDDLNKHSKGKESYLEKRAFLERSDYREYEIEKGLRTKARKLRESH